MIATARWLLPGVATLVLATVAAASAATVQPPAAAPDAPVVQEAGAWQQTGIATYYRASRRFSRTSSGERYDENAMTAASPVLPLGTRVRVTREDTGESIVVRINDRQGARGARVIDLSYGAAQRLGIGGTGLVHLTQVSPDTPTEAPLEVAEAPDDAVAPDMEDAAPRYGRRRHHRGRSVASAHHRPGHVRVMAALARHAAPHVRAARHRT